jgi:hypothetical protein
LHKPLVYKWRRETRRATKSVEFAPVVVEVAAATSLEPPSGSVGEAAVVTVELNQARIRIGSGASAALVAATLKALRA